MIGPGFAAGVGASQFKIALIVLGVVALLAVGVGYELALWRECLIDHPWWYCLRVLA